MSQTNEVFLPLKIFRVKSRSTDQIYFLGIPSADTDMITNGLILLASAKQNEIHLFEADSEEYPLGPMSGAKLRAEKENRSQGRMDLKPIGLDFSQRSLHSKVCEYAFHDVVADGHADAIEVIEIQTFLNEGGTIVDCRDLE